ncbi:hypothetical protein VPH35_049448 [Triticum aestivum]|uniref:Uncharacterized protein n=1 Tax=Triticum aestivum TaxID=4565 RepID=A0A077RS91_WHEAT|nr:unnamed protein product [Triticum aestivum]
MEPERPRSGPGGRRQPAPPRCPAANGAPPPIARPRLRQDTPPPPEAGAGDGGREEEERGGRARGRRGGAAGGACLYRYPIFQVICPGPAVRVGKDVAMLDGIVFDDMATMDFCQLVVDELKRAAIIWQDPNIIQAGKVNELAAEVSTTSDRLGYIASIFPEGHGPSEQAMKEATECDVANIDSLQSATSYIHTAFNELNREHDAICKGFENDARIIVSQISKQKDDVSQPVHGEDAIGQPGEEGSVNAPDGEEDEKPEPTAESPPHGYSDGDVMDDDRLGGDSDEGCEGVDDSVDLMEIISAPVQPPALGECGKSDEPELVQQVFALTFPKASKPTLIVMRLCQLRLMVVQQGMIMLHMIQVVLSLTKLNVVQHCLKLDRCPEGLARVFLSWMAVLTLLV